MVETSKRCSVSGCNNPVLAKGICDLHYRRLRRHGNLEAGRPADWGVRATHPLYGYWSQIRRNGIEICEQWHRDFWAFVRDVGERPGDNFFLYRPIKTLSLGPGNAIWSESKAGPAKDVDHSIKRSDKAAYMRAYNARRRSDDPLIDMRSGLDRAHGITLEAYEAMMDDQGGVCAICGRPEHRTSTAAARPMRLAVDHEHGTTNIRGLLCSMCNHAIGYLEDSPALLRRAIAYLEQPPAAKFGFAHRGKHKLRRITRPPSPYAA